MEIKKRNRAELKSYFVKNAIPTENNFADLVDAALIQASDGVAKPSGDPLSVEAVGDDTSRKQVLNLYSSFSDNGPAYSIELKPRSEPNNAATGKDGLSISDGAGTSRLFIQANTGNIGIGTNEPSHPLHVKADDAVGLLESTGSTAYLRLSTNEGMDNRVELANRPGGRLALSTAGGGDSLNILRGGNIGVREISPQRPLHVGAGGQISVAQGNTVSADGMPGLYWHSNNEYSLHRTSGAWNGPNYQQLVIDFQTGIILRPGTGNNAGHGKSYVNITEGKGLRVEQGTLVVGGTDPGESKLRVQNSATDFTSTQFAASGCGELRMVGWASGWNINAQTNGKHLYINRDSGGNSNLYLGRAGLELQVQADGRVGILSEPLGSAALTVNGNIRTNGVVRADSGLDVGGGNLSSHINKDGAIYRFDGQVYIVVDDNLYIRDSGGGVKFHFDTNSGQLGQPSWTAVSFQDGWRNYGSGYNTAAYYKSNTGRVYLRGLVKAGLTGHERTIFTLPAGLRPPGRELRIVISTDSAGRIDIMTDGRVVPSGVRNSWVSLDGISFRP